MGAADRTGPAARQDTAERAAPEDLGDFLAAPERREVAQHPCGAWCVVASCAAVHSLGEAGCLGAPARAGPAARHRAWHDLSRRHQPPGSPQGGGRTKKGVDSRQRDVREALGPSRGGYGTKACVIADGRGRTIAFALASGQAHELPLAPGLLGCLPDVPGWIVGDRGFASDAFRERIWNLGARPAIPPKRRDAPSPARRGSTTIAISSRTSGHG